MITSLAHKIHKLPSITVARVNFSIHRNKSFSLPTMSELRFLLYNTWMTRWNLSVGTVLTFPARLLFFFFFFTWTKLWEPPEGTTYKLTEEKPLRPSPTESGGWGSATAAPADHLISPPFLHVNRFQTFFYFPTDSLLWVGTPTRVYTPVLVSVGFVELAVARFPFHSFDTQQTCNEITTKSRTYNPIPV